MGFETLLTSEEFHPLNIWTLSLWDLKLFMGDKLYIPTCIWTLSLWDLKPAWRYNASSILTNLNFVPMGFETSYSSPLAYFIFIWTLSLWDLKLSMWITHLKPQTFELCPYGIWNSSSKTPVSTFLDLNFVPMGFETLFVRLVLHLKFLFELCPYGIWNKCA